MTKGTLKPFCPQMHRSEKTGYTAGMGQLILGAAYCAVLTIICSPSAAYSHKLCWLFGTTKSFRPHKCSMCNNTSSSSWRNWSASWCSVWSENREFQAQLTLNALSDSMESRSPSKGIRSRLYCSRWMKEPSTPCSFSHCSHSRLRRGTKRMWKSLWGERPLSSLRESQEEHSKR